MITAGQIRAILVGGAVLCVFAFGVFVGWRIQDARVVSAQDESAKVVAQLAECQSANDSLTAQIAAVKLAENDLAAGYQKRLDGKAELVRKVVKIDRLQPVEPKEAPDEEAASDPLLAALNGLYPSTDR